MYQDFSLTSNFEYSPSVVPAYDELAQKPLSLGQSEMLKQYSSYLEHEFDVPNLVGLKSFTGIPNLTLINTSVSDTESDQKQTPSVKELSLNDDVLEAIIATIIEIKSEELSGELSTILDSIFAQGRYEQKYLEQGDISEFSAQLLAFISAYQKEAVKEINSRLDRELDPSLLFDTLSILGKSNNQQTHFERKDLLINFLGSKIPRVRHGAIMGISSLKDPTVVPEIERAIEVETVPFIRDTLVRLSQYLTK